MIEAARPLMEVMIEKITGAKVVSLHHDIRTLTGEEVVLFSLDARLKVRDHPKK